MISLTKGRFLRWCNEIWSALRYPRTTGHSFQIGGTTELLIAGTPPPPTLSKLLDDGLPNPSCVTGIHWMKLPLFIFVMYTLPTVDVGIANRPLFVGVSQW